MKRGARARRAIPPLFASWIVLAGCNAEETDSADGLGGAPAGGKHSGAGGVSEGTGGRKPTSGGGAHAGGSESLSSGGKPPSGNGGGGAASGGEAGALGSGGMVAEEPEPRWVAFRAESIGAGNPLFLLRSDGESEPVEISEGIFGHAPISWAPDGKSLIFSGWACCGEASTAFELSVDGEELGTPVPIHSPLPAGSLLQYAAYSPSGDYILAQIPNGSMASSYALRLREADVTDWVTITPPGSAASVIAPAWSPDGGSVIMVVADSSGGQLVYRFDVDQGSNEAYEILSLPTNPNGGVQGILWSPDSQHFVIRDAESLHLGTRSLTEVLPLAGLAESASTGQGGEGNENSPAEYGSFHPLAFAPDSKTLLYGSFDEGPVRGSMRLTAVDLEAGPPFTKSVLLESQDSRNLLFTTFAWPESGAAYLSADVETGGKYDVLRIDLSTKQVETRVRLEGGAISHDFSWIPAGIVQLTDTDSDYIADRLTFTGHDDAPEERTTLFEFGANETPNWSGFTNYSSPTLGGFFRTIGATPEFESTDARLWHFTREGTLRLVAGPLPARGEIAESGAFDPGERQFIFAIDESGDGFYEIALTQLGEEGFQKAQIIADLLDYSGSPQGFVWQP